MTTPVDPLTTPLTGDDIDAMDARADAALAYADGCPEGDPGADIIDDVAWDVLRLAVEVRTLREAMAATPKPNPPTLPPIGSRWGDLTEEQCAALPVGTVMEWQGATKRKIGADRWRFDGATRSHCDDELSCFNVIVSYPEAPK